MAYSLSVAEVAKKLGITVQAVYKRIHQGTLDAVQVNRRYLVNDEAGSVMIALPAGRPRKGTGYCLMNASYPVMDFNYREEDNSFKVYDVHDASRAPLGTVTRMGRGNGEVLRDWWEHRSIPESREGLDAKLAELGVAEPGLIPFRNLGLSLSDQYWICPRDEHLDWHDINYFENDFGSTDIGEEKLWDDWLGQVGLDSPDNTSEGVLPKRWVCQGKRRFLLKGGNPWCDQQIFNEAVATALHRRLLLPEEYAAYDLVKDVDDNVVASKCECFINPDEEFIPASRVIATQGKRAGESDYDAFVRLVSNLGVSQREVELFVSKMIVCDSIIANGDRHLRNFGLVRDIDSLVFKLAPLFDSGNSLWYDKDESAVAQCDWSFISKPFDPVPNRQLYLAGRMEWLDAAMLDGFADEAATILEESLFALPRLDYIRSGIQKRIEAVLDMRS